jgi:5'-methylthioadenosine phosphorylase
VIGFIGGTSLIDSSIFKNWSHRKVKTPYGTVSLKNDGNSFFLQRHGNPPLPPHRINHRGNIWALKSIGAERIIAVNSVGSLKLKIKPLTFLIPDDYLSPWNIPTFFDNDMNFTVPLMDTKLAAQLYKHCRTLKIPVKHGGIYVQTQGPRLETKAEINMLRRFGDVIGMTMASEVTLCLEYGMPYASICSIDNYCHGIAKVALTMEEIQENVRKNLQYIETMIGSIRREVL